MSEQSGEWRKTPWMRWAWCCPGSQPAAGAHPGRWRWIKQAELTPAWGGLVAGAGPAFPELSWRMDVLSSAGQGYILHLPGAVVTLPEEGEIPSDPFSCHCATCWEEIPYRESCGCSLTALVSTPRGANEAFIYSCGFCLFWRVSEQRKVDRS